MAVPTFGVTAAMLEAEVAGIDLTNFTPGAAGALRAITRSGARVAGLLDSLGESASTIEAATTGVLYQRCQELTILHALSYILAVREGGTSDQARAFEERAKVVTAELREQPGSLGSERSTAYTASGTVVASTDRATTWATARADQSSTPATRLRDMLERGVR